MLQAPTGQRSEGLHHSRRRNSRMVGNVVLPIDSKLGKGGLARQDTIQIASTVNFAVKHKGTILSSLFGAGNSKAEKLFALDASRWTPSKSEENNDGDQVVTSNRKDSKDDGNPLNSINSNTGILPNGDPNFNGGVDPNSPKSAHSENAEDIEASPGCFAKCGSAKDKCYVPNRGADIYMSILYYVSRSFLMVFILKLWDVYLGEPSGFRFTVLFKVSGGINLVAMFAGVLGFTLVFRINLAYARWWDSRKSADGFAIKWFNAAMLASTFDQFTMTSSVDHYAFRMKM